MPRTITNDFNAEKNRLRATSALVHLLEIQIDSSEAIRVTDHDAAVVYDGRTFDPFPIRFGDERADSDGGLYTRAVTVSNVGNLVMEYLEADQLVGQACRVWVASVAALTAGDALDVDYEVMGAAATMDAVTFTLGLQNLLGVPFPRERFLRTRCRWLGEYGSGRCGYDTSLPDLLTISNPPFDPTTCDGSLEGTNGCRAHGDNEEANGVPRAHPLRYGGEPGIGQGRFVV